MRVTTALGLLFCAGAAIAHGAQAGAPPTPPGVSYVGGQLKIDVLGATLADVLAKVAALTGVTIDLPEAAKDERLPVVQLGPGPAREVLASLLSDSDLDYLIQASDADPTRLQSVMIMPREKKGSPADAAARAPHSPFGRSEAPPAPVEDATAEAAPVTPPPEATRPDASAPPAPDNPGPLVQPVQPNATRPGALSPPQSLDPQSINQQLQQMYQQRVQMMQQERLAGPTGQQAPITTVRQ